MYKDIWNTYIPGAAVCSHVLFTWFPSSWTYVERITVTDIKSLWPHQLVRDNAADDKIM